MGSGVLHGARGRFVIAGPRRIAMQILQTCGRCQARDDRDDDDERRGRARGIGIGIGIGVYFSPLTSSRHWQFYQTDRQTDREAGRAEHCAYGWCQREVNEQLDGGRASGVQPVPEQHDFSALMTTDHSRSDQIRSDQAYDRRIEPLKLFTYILKSSKSCLALTHTTPP